MVIQKMSNWLSGFFLLLLMCQSQSVLAQTKHNPPMRAGLELAMKKFVRAIKTGDTNLFLSLVSRSAGVKLTNTILNTRTKRTETSEILQYNGLASDFRKKGVVYDEFFSPAGEDGERFFDQVKAVRRGRWVDTGHDTFMPAFAHPFLDRGDLFIRWQKNGSQWVLKEIGRPES